MAGRQFKTNQGEQMKLGRRDFFQSRIDTGWMMCVGAASAALGCPRLLLILFLADREKRVCLIW